MFSNIDVGKISEVLLKYKTEFTFLGMLALLAFSFLLGRATANKSLPDKDDYCEDYKNARDGYKTELDKCQDSKDEEIDEEVDAERIECKERENNAVKEKGKNAKITNCRIAKALHQQCEKQKRQKKGKK
jgi:hypothetical protein